MTEEEAKTKWCPFSSVMMRPTEKIKDKMIVFHDCVSSNRVEGNQLPSGVLCIGSACMAWRTQHRRITTSPGEPPPGPGWVQLHVGADGYKIMTLEDGFCGLAGKL